MRQWTAGIVFVLVSFLSGCAATVKPVAVSAPVLLPQEQMSLGMTREAVTALMSRPVTVGFDVDSVTGELRPVQVASLYSSEILSRGAEGYFVDYYIVDIDNVHARIADADLFPAVFKNGLLVAKGQAGLRAIQERLAAQ